MTNTEDLKLALNERLWTLMKRVHTVERDLRAVHDRDWTERAIQRENDEVLEGLDVLTRAEMQMIRDALQRMETGQYGWCVMCGRPIEAARLRAEPAVAMCHACADRLAVTRAGGHS